MLFEDENETHKDIRTRQNPKIWPIRYSPDLRISSLTVKGPEINTSYQRQFWFGSYDWISLKKISSNRDEPHDVM